MCKALFPSSSALVIEASKSNSSLRQLSVYIVHSVNCADVVTITFYITFHKFWCYKLLQHIAATYIHKRYVCNENNDKIVVVNV